MAEVRQLHWWFLADLDRRLRHRLPRPEAPPPTPCSDSLPIPSASSPERPGDRPLPPSQWTARELFTVGRRFKILLMPPRRLTQVFTVLRHGKERMMFRGEYDPPNQSPRRLPWSELETLILENRERWLTSVPRSQWPSQTILNQRASRRGGPAPSSS